MTARAGPSRIISFPLAKGERDGLMAALKRAGLPMEDVKEADHLFWRFETADNMPAGFGGLEIHGTDGLMRSVVTLPPVRGRGIGGAIVTAIETEAAIAGCRALWLLTESAVPFFRRLGYQECARAAVPEAIRMTPLFASLCPASATAMVKRLA